MSKTLTRKPNNLIDDASPYKPYIEAWQKENDKQELIERPNVSASKKNSEPSRQS